MRLADGPRQRRRELRQMRVEVAAHAQQSAADFHEIAEVQRARLVVVKLRRQDGQHFAADNPASMKALVFKPTTAALWYSESK
jgi:hypothetical protein